ncbi:MAG: cytochrome c oxidase subunit II [Planctomycetes bacterium]|nr:cytochrome c oxidase subunit II [Planctomycetota bacterium]
MQRYWSLLFLLVPVFCVVLCVMAPGHDWWLPKDVSSYGASIDHLFKVILGITTIAFVGTQATLVYVLFRFAGTGQRADFVHTNHRLELWWTVIPAGILVFIAFYQFNAWSTIKVQRNFPNKQPDAEVLAGQFEWRIRYPGPDGKIGTLDDILSLNDLHVPVDEDFVIRLRSRDVLHSFFLPNLRVKQDAVPGMVIPVWFRATQVGTFELTCAELCGWGHYKMRGRLTVESMANYQQWLSERAKEQEVSE